ncbi:hypothetical protein BS78_03G208500 [Paspalum vaginatum]|nr:hypothetical protein BS78_03G208500 [Paspalum vaginatum]
MPSTPRTPAPDRPPPPVPVPAPPPPPPLETPPPPSPSSQPGEGYRTPPLVAALPPPLETPPSPSPPGDEYHTPTPSLDDASPREDVSYSLRRDGKGPAKSPQLSPLRLPSPSPPLRPPPAAAPTGQEGTGAAPRPQLRLATGLVRTPSQGSLATTKSPSPSPSPTPPSPLTPAPAANGSSKSGQSTPRRAEAWKPPLSPAAARFDPVEEAVTSPLQVGNGKARLDQHQQPQPQRHAAAAAEDGGAVPPDVAAVAAVGERRALSVTLRLATAVLSLAAFAVIVSDRTSGWAGDYFARHQQYRYAVVVNVIVCAYSIAQSFGEIRRLISRRFIFRSMSSYYCSLFLDQVLAYLLMSASSAAASRNDLWVSRFGTDAFNRKISSALWLSFIGFLMLALNALISTANLFSMA